MEFGYRAVFIAVPPTAPSVTSYVNRDTNAWKRKGLTGERRGKGRVSRDRNTTSVTLKIEKGGGERGKKKEGEKLELQRVNR